MTYGHLGKCGDVQKRIEQSGKKYQRTRILQSFEILSFVLIQEAMSS